MAGDVQVGDRPAGKPGQLVADDADLSVAQQAPYVSRGGIKLENALDAFGLSPEGRLCLDVGASTGGFTDCLLQRGAAAVTALDVAYGELHWRIRQDPRVTVIERTQRALAGRRASCPTGPISSSSTCRSSRSRRCFRPCWPRPRRSSTAWRSSSRSSRSGAGGSGREGWSTRPTTAARRSSRSGARPATASARPCSATRRRGCRAPRATSRASSGWPRPSRAGAADDLEAAARRAEP